MGKAGAHPVYCCLPLQAPGSGCPWAPQPGVAAESTGASHLEGLSLHAQSERHTSEVGKEIQPRGGGQRNLS